MKENHGFQHTLNATLRQSVFLIKKNCPPLFFSCSLGRLQGKTIFMKTAEALQWIDEQKKEATALLIKWASINSWSENPAGLAEMAKVLKEAFSPLADETEEIEKSLLFFKRKSSPHKILLGGHMDTVYPPHSPFQNCHEEGIRLVGPGVADMKGGLVVLYLALAAFEKFGNNQDLGWITLINPDEEIGSPGSRPLWHKLAKQVKCALLFEPSFSDGAIVSARKGSMNFHLTVKGTEAHAGRDFHKGKSAIKAISLFITEAYTLSESYSDLSLNVAGLHSDFPLNVVAGEANAEINIRSFDSNDLEKIKLQLEDLTSSVEARTGTSFALRLGLQKKPKPFSKDLFEQVEIVARDMDLKLTTRESGGLSDGNILAESGLPCIDTLGVVGGHLHTPNEYMEIESMVERAKLIFLFLNRFAKG